MLTKRRGTGNGVGRRAEGVYGVRLYCVGEQGRNYYGENYKRLVSITNNG